MKALAPAFTLLLGVLLCAASPAAARSKKAHKKKPSSHGLRAELSALGKKLAPKKREPARKNSGPGLNLHGDDFRAAADDASRSLSRLADSTAGDRRKLGSMLEGLGDSLRAAWNRLLGR